MDDVSQYVTFAPCAVVLAVVQLNRRRALRDRDRIGRALVFLLALMCAARSYEAPAQVVAPPVQVQPMPVDPALLHNHPAIFDPTNLVLPTFPGGASGSVTPAGLPVAPGRTAGNFEVSPTGAATYSIPLWTPPGARGIQPHLSLVYSSHTSNGLLGPGWILSGLSAISRCGATWAQDGNPAGVTLTNGDKYCLDGRRLRVTNGINNYGQPGSTYQTEIANFSNVMASTTSSGNGPSYFTVQGKDGLTYEYGNTADSRVFAPNTNTPYLWALDKISDRQGNNLIVAYVQANGDYTPSTIEYTQTPSTSTTYHNVISFVTGPRRVGTNLTKYVAGSEVQRTTILNTITVSTDSTVVRQFNLSYANGSATGQPRLSTVQECSASDCLSPTAIIYQDGTAGVASPTTSAGTSGTVGTSLTADIDGDGHADLLYSVVSGTTAHWWVKFGATTGFGPAVDTLLVTSSTDIVLLDDFLGEGKSSLLAPQSGSWSTVRWNGTSFVTTPTHVPLPNGGVASIGQCATADVSGSGKADLVCLDGGALYIRMNTSTTSVNFGSETSISTAGYEVYSVLGNNQFTNSNLHHVDFNGDGHDDLAVLVSVPPLQTQYYGILLSTGSASPPGLVMAGVVGFTNSFIPINFNDDACTDVISGTSLIISACNGSNSGQTIQLGGTPVLVADWDGDGHADIWVNSGGTFSVYLSRGDSLSAAVPTSITVGVGTYEVLDLDGDGLDDLVFLSSSTKAITYGIHKGAGVPPDLAISFTDGFGMNVSPSYVSIAQNNYQKYTDGVYPDVDWQGPLYVVSSFLASDGMGGTYNQAFGYYGARINLQGRGFDGFYAMRIYDNRNQLPDYKYYSRSFPTTGMLLEDELQQPNAIYMYQIVNSPATTTLDGTSYNERYFSYISQVIELDKEVGGTDNGNIVTQLTKNFVYDTYGNATTITTALIDEDVGSPWYAQTWQNQVVQTIAPNTADWCLNLPTQITVKNTLPAGTSLTRTTSFAPDYVNCRINSQIAEPSSSTLKVTTT